MVRTCDAPNCKEKFVKGARSQVTFHKFPSNPIMKDVWLKAMNKENFTPNKFSSLCSKHFEVKCFQKNKKIRILRRDAVPSFPEAIRVDRLKTVLSTKLASTSTIINEPDEPTPTTSFANMSPKQLFLQRNESGSSPESPLISAKHLEKRLKFEKKYTSKKSDSSKSSLSSIADGEVSGVCALSSSPIKTSSTATASEAEYEIKRLADRSSKAMSNNPHSLHPRYVGDCLSDDMASPRNAKHNWRVARGYIAKQKQKIKTLQQKKRRLTARIRTIKSLMKELKQNYNLSQNAETTLLVCK